MHRREFVALGAAAAAGFAAEKAAPNRPTLCFFSKHLPDLKAKELAKTVRQMGYGGIDLTVRPKGHILPERVAEDLPGAVDSIRAEGITVPMITTEILSASDRNTRAILSTASRLQIPAFKLGYWKWSSDPEETVRRVGADIRDIVALAQEFGITAGMHNHAGYVGLAVWDTREMIRNLDAKWIGYYYDSQHARSEGGVGGWHVSLNLAVTRLKMVALKDFTWQKVDGKWSVVSCPLGDGMVDFAAVFAALAAHKFTGPISIHQEYDTSDTVAAAHKDREFASQMIEKAYAA